MLLLPVEMEVRVTQSALKTGVTDVREQEPVAYIVNLPAPPPALNVAPVEERE